jgi:AhpC/TSA family/Disulphide bond corrector protein DsbC
LNRFEERGLQLVAISYDSEAILKFFADRHEITFPLLADPDSEIIRAYNLYHAEAAGFFKGMARPGYFFLDTTGTIKEKFFEPKYRRRHSGHNVISRLFPQLGSEVTDTIEAPNLQVNLEQSDRAGIPGTRITLTAEIRLPPDVHVYAPGTRDYKPIALVIDPQPTFHLGSVVYPPEEILYLPAIKERVPVFARTFRISQDATVSSAANIASSLGPEGKTLTIQGKLEYQACNSETCFLPASVPVQWRFLLLPLDRRRAPESIQHK